MGNTAHVVAFREQAIAELVRFSEQHQAYDIDRATLELLFTTHRHSDEAIIDVWDGEGQRRLVASVIAYDNANDAAEIIVLGYRPGNDLDTLADLALSHAEQVVRQTPAAHLEIILTEPLALAANALRARGYEQSHRWLTLELEPIRSCPHLDLEPPPGLCWTDVDEHNVEASHDCYLRSFATVTGGQVPPLDKFRTVMLATEPPRMRVLPTAEGVSSFVRVMMGRGRRGEIRVLGRHPDSSVKGLGSAALAEGLRQLAQHGAELAFLEVGSNNPAALSLYRKFGFAVARDLAAFRKAVR